MAWYDATYVKPETVASLPTPTLNALCLDISKSTVDRLWRGVSGRGLSLDPLTTSGPIARQVRGECHARRPDHLGTNPAT